MKDDHREEETRTASGKADQPKDPIAPAQRLGRYLVLSEVGRGAMGQVYAAYDPTLDRRVALKVLRGGDGPKERKRFLREAKALARISHPNVLTVHEVEEVGEQVIIALEFVSGGTLKDWLREHPPGGDERLREALELLVQAGKGLMAAHVEGLIHRDFKPSNVLVGHDGRVRVADFGLARRTVDVTQDEELDEARIRTGDVAVDPKVTQTGLVAGTPAYMAPEQWSGGELDARADQFSFCVVAWEVLFGERPYGATPIAGPTATSEVRRPEGTELPAGLDAALRKGLSVRPAGRFRDMDTLIQELETGLDALLGRKLRRARRRGWRLLGAGVLVAASVWALDEAREARLVAACEALGAELDPVWNAHVRDEILAALRATPKGELIHDEDRLSPWLDKQAEAIKAANIEICRHSTVDEDWSPAVVEKAEWCTTERRHEFEEEVESYRLGGEAIAISAVERALHLPSVTPCLDPRALDNLDIPRKKDRAKLRELRSRLRQASRPEGETNEEHLSIVREVERRANELDWKPLLIDARHEEGSLLMSQGNSEAATEVWKEAWFEAAEAANWEAAAMLARDISWVASSSNADLEESRLWLALARVSQKQSYDPSGSIDDSLLESEISLESRAGRQEKAEQLALQLLERKVELFGRAHFETADAMELLASALREQGKYEQSEQLQIEAIKTQEELFGRTRTKTATDHINLALTQRHLGKFPQAREGAKTAYAIMHTLAPDSPELANILIGVAVTTIESGDTTKGVLQAEEALKLARKQHKPGNTHILDVLTTVADILRLNGRPLEALELYRETEDIAQEALGPTNWQSIYPKTQICLTLADHHSTDEATTVCRELEESLSKVDPVGPREAQSFTRMSLAFAKLRLASDAVSWGRKAVDHNKELFGDRWGATATAKMALAQGLALSGREIEARELADEGLRSARGLDVKVAGDDLGLILGLHGAVYSTLGDYETALESYREAIEVSPHKGRVTKYRETVRHMCSNLSNQAACKISDELTSP